MMAQVTPSIQSLEWSKYLAFVSWMAPAVLTRLETHKFLQAAQTTSIVAAILQELTQIATARGIALEDITFFPTKTLSQLAFDDRVTHLQQMGDQLAAQAPLHKISTLQDVEQGKRLEVEETLGYAVRQGAALGIPTPIMDTCYKLIAGINHYLQ
jgi:2-dehydropantoate 2-reductase